MTDEALGVWGQRPHTARGRRVSRRGRGNLWFPSDYDSRSMIIAMP
jgi:hypothetical protein